MPAVPISISIGRLYKLTPGASRTSAIDSHVGGEDKGMGLFAISHTKRHCSAERPPHDSDALAIHVSAFANQFYGRQHHRYVVIRRGRGIWLESCCSVFIDFGDHLLVKLEIYDDSDLPCIRYVPKRHLSSGTGRDVEVGC